MCVQGPIVGEAVIPDPLLSTLHPWTTSGECPLLFHSVYLVVSVIACLSKRLVTMLGICAAVGNQDGRRERGNVSIARALFDTCFGISNKRRPCFLYGALTGSIAPQRLKWWERATPMLFSMLIGCDHVASYGGYMRRLGVSPPVTGNHEQMQGVPVGVRG